MNLRGAVSNKAWKQRLRKRAEAEIVDLRARHVIVDGIEYDAVFRLAVNGHPIGNFTATKVYFENGQRVAEFNSFGHNNLNVLVARLMRAFYSIEARIT